MEEEEASVRARAAEASAGEALLDAALASGQLAPQPLTEYERLEPSHALHLCSGHDIYKKSAVRKGRVLLSFPGRIAPLVAGGTFGKLRGLTTGTPRLDITLPQGRLQLHGTVVCSKQSYMLLQCNPKLARHTPGTCAAAGTPAVQLEDAFDKLVVFSRAVWCDTEPSVDLELPWPAGGVGALQPPDAYTAAGAPPLNFVRGCAASAFAPAAPSAGSSRARAAGAAAGSEDEDELENDDVGSDEDAVGSSRAAKAARTATGARRARAGPPPVAMHDAKPARRAPRRAPGRYEPSSDSESDEIEETDEEETEDESDAGSSSSTSSAASSDASDSSDFVTSSKPRGGASRGRVRAQPVARRGGEGRSSSNSAPAAAARSAAPAAAGGGRKRAPVRYAGSSSSESEAASSSDSDSVASLPSSSGGSVQSGSASDGSDLGTARGKQQQQQQRKGRGGAGKRAAVGTPISGAKRARSGAQSSAVPAPGTPSVEDATTPKSATRASTTALGSATSRRARASPTAVRAAAVTGVRAAKSPVVTLLSSDSESDDPAASSAHDTDSSASAPMQRLQRGQKTVIEATPAKTGATAGKRGASSARVAPSASKTGTKRAVTPGKSRTPPPAKRSTPSGSRAESTPKSPATSSRKAVPSAKRAHKRVPTFSEDEESSAASAGSEDDDSEFSG